MFIVVIHQPLLKICPTAKPVFIQILYVTGEHRKNKTFIQGNCNVQNSL